MKLAALITASLLLVAACSAQECEEVVFNDLINKGIVTSECLSGISLLLDFSSSTSTPSEITDALNVVCTPECAESVTTNLVLKCGHFSGVLFLPAFCTPTGTTSELGRYCRQTFPEFLNRTIIGNLGSCLNNPPCQGGCDDALRDLTDHVGCCYQSLYNDTIKALLAGALINEQSIEILFTYDPEIWTDCGVPLIERCDIPFKIEDEVDVCTEADLSSSCEDNCRTALDPSTTYTSAGRDAYDDICDGDCFKSIKDDLDAVGQFLFDANCLETDAELGSRCRYTKSEDGVAVIEAVAEACNLTATTCTDDCKEKIAGLEEQFGCCYQSIYNNSQVLSMLGFYSEVSFDGFFFLGLFLGNPTFWEMCEVPLIEPCSPNSAVTVASAGWITIAAQVLAVMLY